MAKIIDLDAHRYDEEPPPPWLRDQRVAVINDPATRFTVANLLDQLQVDPVNTRHVGNPHPVSYTLEQSLVPSTRGPFVDSIRKNMYDILGKYPVSLVLTDDAHEQRVRITYTP